MTGLVRSTVSPSSSIMRRSTPWVLGCCGPMLMIMRLSSTASTSTSAVRSTAPTSRASSAAGVAARDRISWAPSSVSRARSGVVMRGSPRGRCLLELHRDAADAVVLAQRVPFPIIGHQNPRQVGMAAEQDPEQVVGLPLHGLGAGIELEQRVDDGVVLGDLQPDAGAAAMLLSQEVVYVLARFGWKASRE